MNICPDCNCVAVLYDGRSEGNLEGRSDQYGLPINIHRSTGSVGGLECNRILLYFPCEYGGYGIILKYLLCGNARPLIEIIDILYRILLRLGGSDYGIAYAEIYPVCDDSATSIDLNGLIRYRSVRTILRVGNDRNGVLMDNLFEVGGNHGRASDKARFGDVAPSREVVIIPCGRLGGVCADGNGQCGEPNLVVFDVDYRAVIDNDGRGGYGTPRGVVRYERHHIGLQSLLEIGGNGNIASNRGGGVAPIDERIKVLRGGRRGDGGNGLATDGNLISSHRNNGTSPRAYLVFVCYPIFGIVGLECDDIFLGLLEYRSYRDIRNNLSSLWDTRPRIEQIPVRRGCGLRRGLLRLCSHF